MCVARTTRRCAPRRNSSMSPSTDVTAYWLRPTTTVTTSPLPSAGTRLPPYSKLAPSKGCACSVAAMDAVLGRRCVPGVATPRPVMRGRALANRPLATKLVVTPRMLGEPGTPSAPLVPLPARLARVEKDKRDVMDGVGGFK